MTNFGKLDNATLLRTRWSMIAIIAVFAAMGVLAALDIAEDLKQGASISHLAIEGFTVLFCLMIAATLTLTLLRDVLDTRKVNAGLVENLEESRNAASQWRAEAESLLVGLGKHINSQFDTWRLTDVEKDIALFLLKGLSHKEVAHIRGVNDATVRQQSRSIYQKAGVAGRHGLAAFFLEDLSLPASSRVTRSGD